MRFFILRADRKTTSGNGEKKVLEEVLEESSPENGRKDTDVIFGIVDKGNEFVDEMAGLSEFLLCSGHLVCQPPDLSDEVAVLVPLFQDLESTRADSVDDGSFVGPRVAIFNLRDGGKGGALGRRVSGGMQQSEMKKRGDCEP